MNNFNIFAIGGMDEKGKNCLVLEINNDYFLFNVGINLPCYAKLGVNKIVPDIDWIKKNANKIKGIFIGYPSYDNLGTLQYINSIAKNIPIYTSDIGESIINNFFNERSMQKLNDFSKYKIIKVNPGKEFAVENTIFNSFRMISSIPNSLCFSVKTNNGWIVIVDQFIVNGELGNNFKSDLNRIKGTLKDILLLLVGVGNVGKVKEYAGSKYNIDGYLNKELTHKGRKIVCLYDHDYYSFISVLKACKSKQLPFIITSNIFYNNYQYLINNEYISNKGLLALPLSKINELENGVIFIINNKQKLFENISKLISGLEHDFKQKENDLVMLITPTIPGFEINEARCVDQIAAKDMYWSRLPKTYSEIKPGNEDHKYLVSTLKPKYIIPINGLYSDFIRYKKLINHAFPWIEVILSENGKLMHFEKDLYNEKATKTIEIEEKYISNNFLSDMNESLLRERKQMS